MNETTRQILEPFLEQARSIPKNWPGDNVLFADINGNGDTFLNYHGTYDAKTGITINQWRALLKLVESESTKEPTIWVEGPKPLHQALKKITNNWIEAGNYCEQTVMDLRDACKWLISNNL